MGQVVVVAREAASGDLRLVAYVVAAEAAPDIEDLRVYLKDRLPAYMVPTDFVLLESLPLNPSGKVDRRALPAPEADRDPAQGADAPRDADRGALGGIWEQVLNRAPIGIHDNFFELGGHSLPAPQILSRVESAFQVHLPLRVFFESPTIAGMATQVELILLQEIEALSDEEAEMRMAAGAGRLLHGISGRSVVPSRSPPHHSGRCGGLRSGAVELRTER